MRINTGITIWLSCVVVVTILVGICLSYFVSGYFKDTVLKREVDVNAKFITLQANQNLKTEDFVSGNYDKKAKTFSDFFHQIDTDEIVRIKVWSPDGTVIYSDDKTIVGKNFDDDGMKESLSGEVVSDISDLQAEENVSEKSFDNLMEIYIPVKLNSNKVVGVIETYVSMDSVNASIVNVNKIILLISVVGISIIGVIVFLTFSTLRKNVINPIMRIHEHAREIEIGNLEIKSHPRGYEELKNLGDEIEIMASRLKEQKERIIKTERLSAIGELAARLAHDLRNPLNVIRLSSHIITKKYGSSPEIDRIFNTIERSVQRMSHQIETVMDFVATKQLQLESVSVNELLKSVINNLSLPDSIKINLPPNDIMLDCDRMKLEVVFENILLNAKQAMKDSGQINIRIIEDNKWAKIEVEDSGPGIPHEILPRIFDPLFTTKQEGTGLGLASCKNIVEQHHGSMEVNTELGKGTTFIISIPIRMTVKDSVNFVRPSQIVSV